jgi:hypothetical protein
LYPNPANDFLAISVKDELPDSFSIYNTLGQLIKEVAIASEADLIVDTQSLSQGVYFLKITKENASRTLQFVKE